MKLSEMKETELRIFEMLSEKIGIQATSTEELREAIDIARKQAEAEMKVKIKLLAEYEKILSKLEKGNYK